MKFLVDANVLSEVTRPTPNPAVVSWLREHEHELVVDPIIVGEVRFSILLLPGGQRRKRLEQWFDEGVKRIACLPFDEAAGLRWAALLAKLRTRGETMPVKDSLIATTALVHGLTVATRNQSDFRKAGVRIVNPFED